jgi:hypothetical protein
MQHSPRSAAALGACSFPPAERSGAVVVGFVGFVGFGVPSAGPRVTASNSAGPLSVRPGAASLQLRPTIASAASAMAGALG